MSAIVSAQGQIRQLDRRAEPDEVVTVDDAGDSTKLARLLTRILAEIARQRRRFMPRRVTFQGVASTGVFASPQTISFPHYFGGIAEWSISRVRDVGTVTIPLVREVSNEKDILTLAFHYQGTFDVRIEESG